MVHYTFACAFEVILPWLLSLPCACICNSSSTLYDMAENEILRICMHNIQHYRGIMAPLLILQVHCALGEHQIP
jgi:hypothetical protein